MKNKTILTIIIIILILTVAISSVSVNAITSNNRVIRVADSNNAPDEEWNRTYEEANFGYGCYVQQTSDAGYLIIGTIYKSDESDICLIKTDSEGNKIWNKTIGGSLRDSLSQYSDSVQQTSDGGYILIGRTLSYGEGNGDVWLIKTDSEGDEIWNKTYGEYGISEKGYSFQQTSDGGYIIVGETVRDKTSWDADAWLIKIDSEFSQVWIKFIGTREFEDEGRFVQQTSDGGYIIVGTIHQIWGDASSYIWLIKIASELSTKLKANIASFDFGKISVFVKNLDDDAISDIEWSVSVKGGILGRMNISSNGVIETLDPGMSEKITTGFNSIVKRFGKVTIDVEIKIGSASFTKTFYGFVFGRLFIDRTHHILNP